jgi:hypothetical protein
MKLLRAVGHYAGYPVGAIVLGSLWIFTQVSSCFWKLVLRERSAPRHTTWKIRCMCKDCMNLGRYVPPQLGHRERKPEVSQSLAGGDK